MIYRYRKDEHEIATTNGKPIDLPFGLKGGIDLRTDYKYYVTEWSTGGRVGRPNSDRRKALKSARDTLKYHGQELVRAAQEKWRLPEATETLEVAPKDFT